MGRYITRLNPIKIFRFAVAMWTAALLVACGGPSDPTGPSAQTPASPASIVSPTAPSSQGEAQDTPLAQAVLAYLRSTLSTPYRDVRVDVVSEDEAFSTVQVHLQLRATEQESWEEHVATYFLKNVGGAWRVDRTESFVSVLAPQRTATAEAEITRQLTINDMDISSNAGWAVASIGFVGGRTNSGSTVLRLASGRWEQVAHFDSYFLTSISMADDTNGFAVGTKFETTGQNQGQLTSLILRLSGGKFEEVSHPKMRSLASVEVVSAAEAWAVGDGEGNNSTKGILRFRAGRWEESPIELAPEGYNSDLQLRSISMLPDGSAGIAVGRGAIVELRNGKWTHTLYKQPENNWGYNSPAGRMDLSSVSLLPTGEAFAVGSGQGSATGVPAIIVHLPAPSATVDAGGSGGSEGGSDGNGADQGSEPERWHVIEGVEGKFATANDLFVVSPDDVWVVGYKRDDADYNRLHSAIWRLQNGVLQQVEHPDTGGFLSAIQVLSPATGSKLKAWAGGYGGLAGGILHFQDDRWELYTP